MLRCVVHVVWAVLCCAVLCGVVLCVRRKVKIRDMVSKGKVLHIGDYKNPVFWGLGYVKG